MKIGIATDHRGVKIKKNLIKYLNKKGFEVIDYGPYNEEAVDYPDYAFLIGEKINSFEIDLGILICGTGIGMSIACNKVKGIRCAKVDNLEEAKYAKLHNCANVVTLSSKMSIFKMKDILDVFLNTDFSNEERHIRRVEKIDNYD